MSRRPSGLILSPSGEASALLTIGPAHPTQPSPASGYWTAIDEATASECLAIVVRVGEGDDRWRIIPVVARADRGSGKTQDVEALARADGWIYLIGSQYGRPGGPLESSRSFLARFREPAPAEVGTSSPRPVGMAVVRDRFRLHRAINDALRASGLELVRLSDVASRDYVDGARERGQRLGKAWATRILAGDLPINVEGAAFSEDGNLILGLRFPVTASGQPIVVELLDVARAFDAPDWQPRIGAIRALAGSGTRRAPVGIRDLEVLGRELHVIVGGIDSGLVDGTPPPSRRPFEHRVGAWPTEDGSGRLATKLVRRFRPGQRVEGLASDGTGGFAYVAERLPELKRPAQGSVTALRLA